MEAVEKGPAASEPSGRPPLRFCLSATLAKLTDHELFEICQLNRDWRIERTSDGEIIAMPPAGGRTGQRNFELARMFGAWVEADGTGVGFDSSTGFLLPNSAERSPDVAWVSRDRWKALSEREKLVLGEFPVNPRAAAAAVRSRERRDRRRPIPDRRGSHTQR